MKSLLLSAVAGATLVTGALGAQVTPPKADSTCTKYSDGRLECRLYRRGAADSVFRNLMYYSADSAMAKRAALGLQLRTTGTKRDTLGVFVEGVTPKGPAEAAGIVEGDRIAAINGVDLRTASADTEDEYTNGLASHRLGREVQKLTPGSRVTLRVYSGGRFRDVQVTAGKASELMHFTRLNMRIPGFDGMGFDGPGSMMMFGPDMQMMRERMPMMRKRIEPLIRERMRDLPSKIQLRTPSRMKTSIEEPLNLELDDDEPLEFDEPEPFDFEDQIETVSPEVIRELAATAVQDARVALRRLAADGIA